MTFSTHTHTHTHTMGCFLACFGFKEKKKKKRRKPGNKLPSELHHDNQSYVPLDSDVAIQLDIKGNLASDSSQIKEKPKEPSILKLKKKVRFNLNVKAYEPIPDNDDLGIYLSDGEDETRFDAEIKGTPGLHYEEDAIASSITSYPASYRYQNCRDSDEDGDNDDEDEDLNLDSDLDEIEESDQEVDDVCSNKSDDAWVLSDNDVSKNQVPQQEQTSLVDLLESRSNARDRSRYVSSVLNPVENLSQWKVVKAKAATPQLKLQKENVMSEQDGNSLKSTKSPFSELKMRDSNVSDHSGLHHAIAVDASLTNWLSSLETRPAYQFLQQK